MKRIALSKLVKENVLGLPTLSVPPLGLTVQRHLESLMAIKTPDAIAAQKEKLSGFVNGAGATLQRVLEEGQAAEGGAFAQRLERAGWLRNRLPLEVYRNPGMVLKKESVAGLSDGSQAGVAAALIHGVGCWIQAAVREGVEVGEEPPLDVSPLAHEFGRSLVPSKEEDHVKTVELEKLGHVIVLHDGYANLVEVLRDGARAVVDREVIQRALEVILSTTPDQDNPAPVAVLTAASRSLWGLAHAELAKSTENAETLRLFEEAILVVCLDSKPWDSDGRGNVVGSAVLHGRQEEVENRWYDKHQLIVSADGHAAFNFEASSSWMPHWARWVEEVLRRAGEAKAGDVSAVPAEAVAGVLRPLVVTYGKSFATHVRTARQEATARASSTEGCGVTLPLGSSELLRVGVSSEAFLELALHLAHHRRRGCVCPTSSVVSQSRFYGGLTELARTATMEVLAMCEAFRESVKPGEGALASTRREELAKLVRAAAERHTAVVQAAAAGEGVERHLLLLHRLAEERRNEEALSFFTDPMYQSSSRSLLQTAHFSRPWLSLAVLGPADSRSCGVGITVDKSETRLHVATAGDSPLCTSEEHSQAIITAAMDLYRVLGGT